MRQAKIEFAGLVARYIKTNNKHFFNYIRRRKPAMEAVEPLDDK